LYLGLISLIIILLLFIGLHLLRPLRYQQGNIMTTSPSPSPKGLDFRAILVVPLLLFTPWLAAVLVVTWAGYPGVVCVTPLAWLLALRLGIMCVRRSASTQSSRRVLEATLAGGVFGLLQGLLFIVVVPRLGPIQASEQTSAIMISLIMVAMGILVGAGMSAFTASQTERRLRAASPAAGN
jgi:hypothetical protein